MPVFPPFNWLSYGLLAPPEVDLELCLCGMDLLAPPGMHLMLNHVANKVITDIHPMLWPRTSTVRMHKALPTDMEEAKLPVCASPSLHPPSLARPYAVIRVSAADASTVRPAQQRPFS
jgi:hypothetical protein